MAFSKVFYGGGGETFVDSGQPYPGVIYAIAPNGNLFYYRDDYQNGQNGPNAERGWGDGSGNQIGFGWQNFTHVFSDGDGIIYAVTPDGNLLWYRDADRQGRNGPHADRGWAPGSGSPIGFGWQGFKHVFASGAGRESGGNIYAVTTDGRLLWYRDDDRQGRNGPHADRGWAPGSGNQIGVGWDSFTHVFGHWGVIYAITPDGRLLWYRDDNYNGGNAPDGTTGWAPGSGNQIGVGWQNFTHVLVGGQQPGAGIVIYAVTADGRLLWYRDDDRNGGNAPDGTTGWAPGSGSPIGIGW